MIDVTSGGPLVASVARMLLGWTSSQSYQNTLPACSSKSDRRRMRARTPRLGVICARIPCPWLETVGGGSGAALPMP